MDRPIAVGDLVQVVRGCVFCGDDQHRTIGKIFKVFAVEIYNAAGGCVKCGKAPSNKLIAFEKGAKFSFYLVRLKRIPPLEELEGERTEEKLKETE